MEMENNSFSQTLITSEKATILSRSMWKDVGHGNGKPFSRTRIISRKSYNSVQKYIVGSGAWKWKNNLFSPDSNHIGKMLKYCPEVCGGEWKTLLPDSNNIPKKLQYCTKVCGMELGMEMENDSFSPIRITSEKC